MTHDAKIHVQPESKKKQKGHKPQIQSQKAAAPNLANLSQTGLQHLSRADILALQRTIGNRAVARLMAQRDGENEEEIPGPRNQHLSPAAVGRLSGIIGDQAAARLMAQRQGEGEEEEEIPGPRNQRGAENAEEIPGPRMKPLREDAVQQRGGSELSSSPAQRALVLSSATGNIGDATDLDGDGLFGWDRPMSATDVKTVVDGLVPNESVEDIYEPERIVIFSGTHGTATGNLVNTGAGSFVGEDQATATAANADNPGVQVEVIDVNSYTTKDQLTSSVFGSKNYLRIAAWCYSRRSYKNRATLTANWWPAKSD